MHRGNSLYKSIIKNKNYKDKNKDWYIELDKVFFYNYDLIVNPIQFNKNNSSSLIKKQLKEIKINLEETINKYFIYFICTRQKVIFDMNKKCSYCFLTNEIIVNLLIGKEKKEKRIELTLPSVYKNQKIVKEIIVTKNSIKILYENGSCFYSNIHDFLFTFNIVLNINSKIEYIGVTKNPYKRPLDGCHSGLTNILYNISREENDILIYFNLFKVISITDTKRNNYGMHYLISNSMSDEIPIEQEANIIEKSFILFFNSKNQKKNQTSEYSELTNHLEELQNKYNINSINVNYEVIQDSDYFSFYSDSIEIAKKFKFKILKNEKILEIH